MRQKTIGDQRRAAERLRRRYETAPPQARAYLEAEIEYSVARVAGADTVLELGCGYGRVLERLAPHVGELWGIDVSVGALLLARERLGFRSRCHLAAMDARALAFRGGVFDHVLCVQNGVAAFGGDRLALVREAARVTRAGGSVLLASYAEAFWPHRIEWYEAQAARGLKAPLDRNATGGGVVVGVDGFRSEAVSAGEFRRLAAAAGLEARIAEVAGASLFCELRVRRLG